MLSKETKKKALAVSVFWVLALYFLTEPSATFRWFLLIGVLPVIAFWLVIWTRTSDNKAERSRSLMKRFRQKR